MCKEISFYSDCRAKEANVKLVLPTKHIHVPMIVFDEQIKIMLGKSMTVKIEELAKNKEIKEEQPQKKQKIDKNTP